MGEYLFEIRGVSKSFPGVKALNKVNLKIRPGKVHALMGENGAGKSTLIKCISGLYSADEGEILIDDKPVVIKGIKHSIELGISVIQQELSPIPERRVMENVWLGKERLKNHFFLDDKRMYEETKKQLAAFDMDIDPKMRMGDLSVAKMQMVEIIKAVSSGTRMILMDEPTSALTATEVEQLFKIIQDLKKKGVAIVYVSHKMDEVFQICDEVTVMRDGHYVASHLISEVTEDQLIREMVGRDIETFVNKEGREIGDVELKVENLSSKKAFQDVSFEVRKGEIFGIAGLVGAGRTELLQTLFGLRPVTGGNIYIKGEQAIINTPHKAIKKYGMALLTEDRRKDGIVGLLSVFDNMMLVNYDRFLVWRKFIKLKKARGSVSDYIKRLEVKTPTQHTKMMNLSGGNQQKVLIARWLMASPEIILFDEPTRGIDVGAKAEIYTLIRKLADEGKTILVVSSEMPELLKLSDRILVMHEGHATGILDRSDATEEKILVLASKKSD